MVRSVLVALVVAVAGVLGGASGCGDEVFTAPDQPDLYKVPHVYDLSATQPDDRDLAVRTGDLAGDDLSASIPDLSTVD